ncbi:Vitamin B12 import ATP-binding protein BtuD [Streptomyces microflavus]
MWNASWSSSTPSPPGRHQELPADAPAGIEFDDVRFAYDEERPVLDGFSLTVEPGETMAIVGASGSGKSTVSLLVPRFYDVSHGAVLIGGHDVRELTQASLRSAIGLVPEDSFLFSDTVRSNIADHGFPDATQEQIEQAARAAQAHGFISALPDGYDTTVGEHGLTLSGGQRQRVALALRHPHRPPAPPLDDATSAVDARVEHEIHEALKQVMAGRTTLLIAHRRSTLQLADRIAVLHGGKLAALGTHAELERTSPLYRRLLTDPRTRRYVPGTAAPGEAGPDRDGPSSELTPSTQAPRHPHLWSARRARHRRQEARHPRTARPGRGPAARHGHPPGRRGACRAVRGLLRTAPAAGRIRPHAPASGRRRGPDRTAAAGPDPARDRRGRHQGLDRRGVGGLRDRPGRLVVQWVAQTGEIRMTGRTGSGSSTHSA